MPVIVTTPTPCPEQSALMQALGFSLQDSESERCPWNFTAIGGNGLPPYNLEITLSPSETPSLHQVVGLIIKTGLETGARRRVAAIKQLLDD